MKSHATAATLVGAALLSAAAAVAQTPTTPGRAMKGTLIQTTVASTNVPAPVPITYYLPKNYDAKRAEAALAQSAGALTGVDRDQLLRDVYDAREQDSHGRPA